jgi:hypothetical protein
MRRSPWTVLAFLTAALLALGLNLPRAADGTGARLKAVTMAVPLPKPRENVLRGKVTVQGKKPDLARLTEDLRAAIAKNTDKDFCLGGSAEEVAQQTWQIGAKGGVGNVFVWIEPAETGAFFQVSPEDLARAKQPVVMRQPRFAFVPHCLVLFPQYRDPRSPRRLIPTGQELIIKNDAPKAHNVKYNGGPANGMGNQTFAPGNELVLKDLKASKEPITFACNIHGWMTAYARAFDHPFATLTRADGSYEIKGIPAGRRVHVIAWHERAGYLDGPRGAEVELRPGRNTRDFQLGEK